MAWLAAVARPLIGAVGRAAVSKGATGTLTRSALFHAAFSGSRGDDNGGQGLQPNSLDSQSSALKSVGAMETGATN